MGRHVQKVLQHCLWVFLLLLQLFAISDMKTIVQMLQQPVRQQHPLHLSILQLTLLIFPLLFSLQMISPTVFQQQMMFRMTDLGHHDHLMQIVQKIMKMGELVRLSFLHIHDQQNFQQEMTTGFA